MQNLTVIILTKNEEQNIKAVIENAKKLSYNVLVVDSGSTDNTVSLAQASGAKVVFRAWENDFAAQRNFALECADTKWVLYLDADERMNDELIGNIKQAIRDTVSKQYSMTRRIHAFGFTYKHGIFKPDKVVRLFPVLDVYWENKVHERPICNLPKVNLNGLIEHYTYSSLQQWWDKAGKYTSIWAEDAYSQGKRTSLLKVFMHSGYGFIRAYFIQLGFLDGWSGFYSSIQHYIYTLIKYFKLYERQRR